LSKKKKTPHSGFLQQLNLILGGVSYGGEGVTRGDSDTPPKKRREQLTCPLRVRLWVKEGGRGGRFYFRGPSNWVGRVGEQGKMSRLGKKMDFPSLRKG